MKWFFFLYTLKQPPVLNYEKTMPSPYLPELQKAALGKSNAGQPVGDLVKDERKELPTMISASY